MKWMLPLVTLIVGIVGGWLIAVSSLDSDGSSASAESSSSSSPSLKAKSGGGAGTVVELTEAEEAVAGSYDLSEAWLASMEGMSQMDQLGELLTRLRKAKPKDFVMLMDAVSKYSGTMGWMAQSLLATKWAETDPQGMLAYIEKQPPDQQWRLRSAFYTAWAKSDPQAAFVAAKELGDYGAQQNSLQAVIQSVAEKNPQRAIAMAEEMSSMGHRADWIMRSIYQKWANQDLETARASALSLEDGPGKVQALSGALQNWMHEEPYAALDWLDSLPMDGTVYNSRKEVFRNLLNNDFEVAKEYIASKTDAVERREILDHISFGNLAYQKDFEAIQGIYDWIGEVATGQTYDNKVGDLIRSLAQSDPDRAREFVLNLPAGNARMNALGNLAQQLAERDAEAGIAFAMSLAYEDEKQRALSNMSWQIARYGVEKAVSIVSESSDPMVQRQLASRLASEWSQYDQPGALAWAETLSDEQARGQAMQSVYQNWMQSDPEGAFTYLTNSVEEGKQSDYLRSGFQDWSRQDPLAAIEWLDRMPVSMSESQNANIYRTVASNYVQHDPMAASEWIATLDEGPNRDQSVETLVRSITKTDPEAGFYWAETVSDENKRRNTLNQSVQAWVKTDPDAAFEAIKDSNIGAEEKDALYKFVSDAKQNQKN
jgi:hypothetical protein